MARHGEQPPGEVLPAHDAWPGAAETRDPSMGSADDGDRADPRGGAGRLVMVHVRRCFAGLRALFRKPRDERELDEELQSYLESSVEAKVCSGISFVNGRRAARI